MDQNDTQLEQGETPENNQVENHNMASLLEQEGLGSASWPREPDAGKMPDP